MQKLIHIRVFLAKVINSNDSLLAAKIVPDTSQPMEIQEIKDFVEFVCLDKFFVVLNRENYLFLYTGLHKLGQINCLGDIKRFATVHIAFLLTLHLVRTVHRMV